MYLSYKPLWPMNRLCKGIRNSTKSFRSLSTVIIVKDKRIVPATAMYLVHQLRSHQRQCNTQLRGSAQGLVLHLEVHHDGLEEDTLNPKLATDILDPRVVTAFTIPLF